MVFTGFYILGFGKRTISIYKFHLVTRALVYKYGIANLLCSISMRSVIYCILITIVLSLEPFGLSFKCKTYYLYNCGEMI